MIDLLTAIALLAAPVVSPAVDPLAAAQDQDRQEMPQLGLEHRALARCAAAFALVAAGQEAGHGNALRYPDLRERGREFFVQASAKIMDEASLDRTQIEMALVSEAGAIVQGESIDQVMPPCLALLPAE